jgi:hypothetical protein
VRSSTTLLPFILFCSLPRYCLSLFANPVRNRQALRIPVIANGNIRTLADVEACLAYTGADAVMSAEGLLANPVLFTGRSPSDAVNAAEFLAFCRLYGNHPGMIRGHLFSMLVQTYVLCLCLSVPFGIVWFGKMKGRIPAGVSLCVVSHAD